MARNRTENPSARRVGSGGPVDRRAPMAPNRTRSATAKPANRPAAKAAKRPAVKTENGVTAQSKNRAAAQAGNRPAVPSTNRPETRSKNRPATKAANRAAAQMETRAAKKVPETPWPEAHAPLYDQYDGAAPGIPAAQAEQVRRRGKEKRRITKAEMNRRRMRRRLLAVLFIAAAVLAGAVLSITVLFKVTAFQLQTPEGTQPADTGVYTEAEILNALGVAPGDNIFSFRRKKTEAQMALALPLLESIRVKRKYPGTVVVQTSPAKATYAIRTMSGWAVLSASLRIMEISAQQPELPLLYVAAPSGTQPGTVLAFEDESTLPMLETLLSALENAGMLADVTSLDMTKPEEIRFLYQGRISTLLGTGNNLEYKMQWAVAILQNANGQGCSENDVGNLDISNQRSDGSIHGYFKPGDPVLPGADTSPQAALPENAASSAASSEAAASSAAAA